MLKPLFAPLIFTALSIAQPAIPTAQYDNARTGANLEETKLTPRSVASRFGRLFVMLVEGDVNAQPLYVPKVEIPAQGIHNIVLVATENNGIYAFDAAGQPAAPLWRVSIAKPVPSHVTQCSFIAPEAGITSTPVIDAASRTMYFIARSEGGERYYQHLHAVDITTGAERPGTPVLIRAAVSGSAFFGLQQRTVAFNAVRENPRAALLLSRGTVYIAWGSSCDVGPYYGWVLAYDAHTLRQTGVFNTSPDAEESGIWQSGTGIAADGEGSVYAITGNGKFGGRDYGDSVLKLGFEKGGLAVRDFFTPHNESSLNRTDADLGSTGPVLLPDHLLAAAGKNGMVYLIDRNRMGKYQSGSDSHAVQTVKLAGGVYGAPAYWNGHLYYFGANDVLRDFEVKGGRLSPQSVHQGTTRFANPGAIPAISANGSKDGIVWIVLTKDHRARDTNATLQAYDARDVSRLLYSSASGFALRFTIPTIADGRVYVASRNAVYVYGLRD